MTTKLERFRRDNRLTPKQLREASGLSERTVQLIRKGNNTTIESARALAAGITSLVGREVTVEELFDLSVPKKRRARAVAA